VLFNVKASEQLIGAIAFGSNLEAREAIGLVCVNRSLPDTVGGANWSILRLWIRRFFSRFFRHVVQNHVMARCEGERHD